jgi:hypothetical protein
MSERTAISTRSAETSDIKKFEFGDAIQGGKNLGDSPPSNNMLSLVLRRKSFLSPLFASQSQGTRTCMETQFVDNGQGGTRLFRDPEFCSLVAHPIPG